MPGNTLLNGNPIEPGLSSDRAFHFGDGLFETLAVIDGTPCLWEQHWRRLQQGCERLGIALPGGSTLYTEALSLTTGVARAVLKIIISAGAGGRGYARPDAQASSRWLQLVKWPEAPHYQAPTALSLQWCTMRLGDQPVLAGIKHLNRLEQVLARRELREPATEGLMCDQRGNVVEGIMSNLFLEKDRVLITPAIRRCGITGVVRRLLLDQAQREGREVLTTEVSRRMVEQADRLYVTNSLLGIRAVARLGTIAYPHTRPEGLLARVHAACFNPGPAAQ